MELWTLNYETLKLEWNSNLWNYETRKLWNSKTMKLESETLKLWNHETLNSELWTLNYETLKLENSETMRLKLENSETRISETKLWNYETRIWKLYLWIYKFSSKGQFQKTFSHEATQYNIVIRQKRIKFVQIWECLILGDEWKFKS
jgi:hypothetical protein